MSLSVRDLVLASRPVSWVNTAYPFAAAYLLATRTVDARLIVGTLFFLVPYNLLMYGVNDVFDHESDLANPRKGGAEGASSTQARCAVCSWRAWPSRSPSSSGCSRRGRRRRVSSSSCASRRCSATRCPGCGSRSGRCSTR